LKSGLKGVCKTLEKGRLHPHIFFMKRRF